MRTWITRALAFTVALVLTIAALLVVTAWSFAWADLALVAVFGAGVAVGVWARGVYD